MGYSRLLLALLSNNFKMKFSRCTDGSLSAVSLLAMQCKCFVCLLMFKCQLYFYLPYLFLMDYFFRPGFSKKKKDELILSRKINILSKNTQCIS